MKITLITLSSILIGYLLGSLNPAKLFSKLKNQDLRNQGTGNLGATNAMLILGKSYGLLVMAFDIFKAYLSVKLCQLLFPEQPYAGLLAGSACVVGHVYPFYLRFKGGKGLASLGGLVLGYDPLLFLFLLIVGIAMMLLFNYGIALTLSAAILFPFLEGWHTEDPVVFFICLALSGLIILQHIGVLQKVLRGEDIKIRNYIKNELFRKQRKQV